MKKTWVMRPWCYYAAGIGWGWIGGAFNLPISWVALVFIVISVLALWLMGDLQFSKPLEAEKAE